MEKTLASKRCGKNGVDKSFTDSLEDTELETERLMWKGFVKEIPISKAIEFFNDPVVSRLDDCEDERRWQQEEASHSGRAAKWCQQVGELSCPERIVLLRTLSAYQGHEVFRAGALGALQPRQMGGRRSCLGTWLMPSLTLR